MITIKYDSGDKKGTCIYRLQIDTQLICKFDHNPPDGLATCLHKAADAVELSDWAEFVFMDEHKGG